MPTGGLGGWVGGYGPIILVHASDVKEKMGLLDNVFKT